MRALVFGEVSGDLTSWVVNYLRLTHRVLRSPLETAALIRIDSDQARFGVLIHLGDVGPGTE